MHALAIALWLYAVAAIAGGFGRWSAARRIGRPASIAYCIGFGLCVPFGIVVGLVIAVAGAVVGLIDRCRGRRS